MLKRDSLVAQMQQLSQVLAKVKRLIIEDAEEEAKKISFAIFRDYYQLSNDDLLTLPEEEFLEKIRNKNLKPEELNMLSYFIDEYAGLQDEFTLQLHLYKKYLLLVNLLENEYHFVSLDHISRRTILQEQLNHL
jgi:hypothetical protein